MALRHIEHVLIQTADLEATKDWYVKVLGLQVGYAPDFKFPVYWLYLEGRDVLHLTSGGASTSANRKTYLGQQSEATEGTGVIDHIGFRCDGLRETMRHLTELGIEYKQRQVSDQGLYQLFLFDPNGVKIELNFAHTEAAGLTPEVLAANLA
jgi:catechol 2,3-dioxygenase-like lactoylglutathione lyase family enzyme